MVQTSAQQLTIADLQAELAALSSENTLAANLKRGDAHGINLSQLRALAKRAKKDQQRAQELWATGDTGARLLALLTCSPKAFTPDELDAMLRATQGPKETDWLENYVIKVSPHVAELEARWRQDADPHVEAAAWKLLNHRIGAASGDDSAGGIDLDGVLDTIEQRMATASPRLQWAMNEVLAQIGIMRPEHRSRALAIGEALQVLADYPVSKGCISPFAPVWIREMVSRNEG